MRRKKAFYKRRTVIIASALCAVSALGLAGVYRLESSKKSTDKELVNWEEMDSDTRRARLDSAALEEEEDELELVGRKEGTEDGDEQDGQADRLNPTQQPASDVGQGAITTQPAVPEETDDAQSAGASEEETASASVQNAINLDFQADSKMIWPVEGNVILDYSMDSSIYFPTLDQYKYNPAIAIQSERGTPVLSAAAGVIDSIVETDETGLTMTVDLGNGYKAVYGQLADITLSTGSYVETGTQIATVAEPSIYYQIEGDNLYFQVLKDETAQDPLDYIQ